MAERSLSRKLHWQFRYRRWMLYDARIAQNFSMFFLEFILYDEFDLIKNFIRHMIYRNFIGICSIVSMFVF